MHLLTGGGGAHIGGGARQVRVVAHLAGVLVGQLLVLAELELGRLDRRLLLRRQAVAGGKQLLRGLGRNCCGRGGGQLAHELGGRRSIVLHIAIGGVSAVRISARHRVTLLGNLHLHGRLDGHRVQVAIVEVIARLGGQIVPGLGLLDVGYGIRINLLHLGTSGGHMVALMVTPLLRLLLLMMMMVMVSLMRLSLLRHLLRRLLLVGLPGLGGGLPGLTRLALGVPEQGIRADGSGVGGGISRGELTGSAGVQAAVAGQAGGQVKVPGASAAGLGLHLAGILHLVRIVMVMRHYLRLLGLLGLLRWQLLLLVAVVMMMMMVMVSSSRISCPAIGIRRGMGLGLGPDPLLLALRPLPIPLAVLVLVRVLLVLAMASPRWHTMGIAAGTGQIIGIQADIIRGRQCSFLRRFPAKMAQTGIARVTHMAVLPGGFLLLRLWGLAGGLCFSQVRGGGAGGFTDPPVTLWYCVGAVVVG